MVKVLVGIKILVTREEDDERNEPCTNVGYMIDFTCPSIYFHHRRSYDLVSDPLVCIDLARSDWHCL